MNFMKKEVILRNSSRTARRKINKRKYYGVKKNITQYRRDIYTTFYDKNLLKRALASGIVIGVADYFSAVNKKIDSLLNKAVSILRDTYDKGSKRIMDSDGNTVKLDDAEDTFAINELIGEQQTYYSNISREQSTKVNEIISRGLQDGETNKKIASRINQTVKRVSQRRATTIANTEIVKSHNLGQIETMKQAGIKKYNYITSNDPKVSEICRKNQGPKGRERIYEVQYAGTPNNPLPVIQSHPGCRCTIVIHA